jgi:hypothetical protein
VIEALIAALVAALAKEAPGALVKLLRAAGVLPDDMSDDDVSERLQSTAADILGDVNPMHRIKRRPRATTIPLPPPSQAPEYEERDTEPPSGAA